jgi:hypothetical protein
LKPPGKASALSPRRAPGGKPSHRAVHLIHGGLAAEMAANTSRAMAQERLALIQVFCRKSRPGSRM